MTAKFTAFTTALLSAFSVHARTVQTTHVLETPEAVYYQTHGLARPAVFKLARTEVVIDQTPYSSSKTLVTARLVLNNDKTTAKDLWPGWASLNTVPDELLATSDCSFNSSVKDRIKGLSGNGGQTGQTYSGGGQQICSFTFFVETSRLDKVIENINTEAAAGLKPIRISFEPVTIQSVRDITIQIPLREWYHSLGEYTAESPLSESEAWFAMGVTAARNSVISGRLADLGSAGIKSLILNTRGKFFTPATPDNSVSLRHLEDSALGDFNFAKTIVLGENTYEF